MSIFALLAASVAVGCAANALEAEQIPPNSESVAEENLTSLSVTLEGAGADLEVMDTPRLKPRARGGLSCSGDRFEVDGRVRVSCERSDESLEVIVRDSGKDVLLVHKPARRADRETFYACKPKPSSALTADGLPTNLTCTIAPLRDRPSHGGGLASPFDSTVPGITIPNAHAVGESGLLMRSMAPSDHQLEELKQWGVGAVLIFKNPTGNGTDVTDEVTKLVAQGVEASRVVNIPFKWKSLPNFKEPCEQTIAALKFIKQNVSDGKKTLFHCTVGEDRTGFLSAMYALTTLQSSDAASAWDKEMCDHGYGAGNPLKPSFVLGELENSLMPLFRKMAYLHAKGSLSQLNDSVCATDPESFADFESLSPSPTRLVCGTSTTFIP